MGKQDDSLPSVEGPDRVFYATGALLNAEDFQAEQDYHRGRLARALAYTNGSGTVAGLRVVHEPEVPATPPDIEAKAERIRVKPGLAIDRLGRLIEVQRSLCLRLGKWYEEQQNQDLREGWHEAGRAWQDSPSGVVVDLFIKFVACERGKTPVFALGPFQSIDAVSAARLRDGYEAELIIRKEDTPQDNVPASKWPDFQSIDEADWPAELRNAILDAWEETTSDKNNKGLEPLKEHAQGQDTTALFLARIVIPADEATGNGRPQRRLGDAVEVNNDLRSFVVNANALARMLGLF